ncbi:MAG: hypothetical protein AB1430_23385 [Pseudomonadota bacterium]
MKRHGSMLAAGSLALLACSILHANPEQVPEGRYVAHADHAGKGPSMVIDVVCRGARCTARLLDIDEAQKEVPVNVGRPSGPPVYEVPYLPLPDVADAVRRAVQAAHELPAGAEAKPSFELLRKIPSAGALKSCRGWDGPGWPVVLCEFTRPFFTVSPGTQTRWATLLPDMCTTSCCPEGMCLLPVVKQPPSPLEETR